jgi:FkbM family methyltransferase
MNTTVLKQWIPPILWSLAKRARQRMGWGPQKSSDPRREKLEREYRSWNERVGSGKIVLRPGLEFKIHPDSRQPFESFCFSSPVMVEEMNVFLDLVRGKRHFMDIGAHHGIFSLAFSMLNPMGRVLAVEISPIAFSRLLYNIHANRLGDRLFAEEYAVSDRIGTLDMHYEWEHLVASGTSTGDSLIQVPMCTGNALSENHKFKPDVIKLDVEGHENKVLRGMKEMLAECRPLIFLEVHPGLLRKEGEDLDFLRKYFQQMNYRAQTLRGDEFPLDSFASLDREERLILQPC